MKYRENAQDTWHDYNIKALDSMVIGSIIQFVGTTIPTGWLECDGSTITQSAYPELYNLIGGTLPDFRGRVLVGQDTTDTDFDTLLETGGSKYLQQHKHLDIELAQNHLTSWNSKNGTTGIFSLESLNSQNGTANENYLLTGNVHETQTGNSGNLQPYAVVKHIIKAKNTTPTMASIVNAYSTSTQDGYSCNYVNNLVNYSTTEINTHQKWIDGKDIYRKVLTYDGSAISTNIMINHNITNIGNYRIVKEAGFYYNGTWYYGYANSTSYAMFTGISSTAVDGYIGSSWDNLFSKIFVVIEYTKTTD